VAWAKLPGVPLRPPDRRPPAAAPPPEEPLAMRLAALAERLPTPCFLFSEARLEANLDALRDGFAAGGVAATLRYCAKTNHEAGLLRRLAGRGCEVLVSHPAELELALACGFAPQRVAYQRPVLSADEVEGCLARGVTLLHAQRVDELEMLAAAAARAGARVRVALRLRDEGGGGPLAPLQRRVGLAAGELDVAAGRIAASRRLAFHGVNVYLGTQQPSDRRFVRFLGGVMRRLAEVEARHGVRAAEVNLGGGVPSPGLRKLAGPRSLLARLADRPATPPASFLGGPGQGGAATSAGGGLFAFARSLAAAFGAEAAAAGLAPPPGLAVEPGRSLVGDAGVLLTRVAAVDGRWLFLDASRNLLGESFALFHRRLLPLAGWGAGPPRRVHLSGPTLNTMDVLDLARRLPPARPGALLAVLDAGAYSLSRAGRYAGMAPEAWLLTRDGRLERLRRAEGFAELAAAMEGVGGGTAPSLPTSREEITRGG
jgi:diaminopimelate decarboxylase